jgi:hypothetical protein
MRDFGYLWQNRAAHHLFNYSQEPLLMGWRGTMRSAVAAGRAVQRESERRHRALLKQQAGMAKQAAAEMAAFEVQLHESHLARLLSVHQDCSEAWDWEALCNIDAPTKPEPVTDATYAAQFALETYTPGFFARLFGTGLKKRAKLQDRLAQAEKADKERTEQARRQHVKDLEEWEKMRRVSAGVLAKEIEAYKEAIQEANPFSEISELGSSIAFNTTAPWYMQATIHVKSTDSIPSEIKSLTQGGKISRKKMPQGKFNELYQDYVCSCSMRVARELFSLLPIEMAFVNAVDDLLDPKTGYKSKSPILSVAFTRLGLAELNFDAIDCSDAMANFVHNMGFSKTKGLQAVEQLDPQTFSKAS